MFDTYTAEDIRHLAGARVLRVFSKNDTEITIFTDKGVFYLEAEGDCCSNSFFLNANELKELVGVTLTSVSAREETGGRDRSADEEADENSQWYGADFNYGAGSVYLEMRNDSNGYYGGWCNVRWVKS